MSSHRAPKLPTFGERVKWARAKLRRLTQSQLAEKMDTALHTVRRWEKNTSEPPLERIVAIGNALNVDPCWLAFGRGSPYTLPNVAAYLQTKTGDSLPHDVKEFLREHSYRLFSSLTPSDAEIEVVHVLIARLLRDAAKILDGDKIG